MIKKGKARDHSDALKSKSMPLRISKTRRVSQPRAVKSVEALTSSRKSEPIAVVGVGCRFAPDVRSAEGFWEVLCARSLLGTQRCHAEVSALACHKDEDLYDNMQIQRFLDDTRFDAGFFGLGEVITRPNSKRVDSHMFRLWTHRSGSSLRLRSKRWKTVCR